MRFRTSLAAFVCALSAWFATGCTLLDPPSVFATESRRASSDPGAAPPVEDNNTPSRTETAALSPFTLQIPPVESEPTRPQPLLREVGIASWYRDRRTASGEPYNRQALTAAHPTLPFGAVVKVRNLKNQKETIVRITDRGPFKKGRVIDLSEAAARQIGILQTGLAPVEIFVLTVPGSGG